MIKDGEMERLGDYQMEKIENGDALRNLRHWIIAYLNSAPNSNAFGVQNVQIGQKLGELQFFGFELGIMTE